MGLLLRAERGLERKGVAKPSYHTFYESENEKSYFECASKIVAPGFPQHQGVGPSRQVGGCPWCSKLGFGGNRLVGVFMRPIVKESQKGGNHTIVTRGGLFQNPVEKENRSLSEMTHGFGT